MKNSTKIRKKKISEQNNQSPRKIMENNSHNFEIEKRKEELIATLFSRVVIRQFGSIIKMLFPKIKSETEEVSNDGEIIEGADKPETVGEKISVEEVQKELPLKESSTAEELSQFPGIMIGSKATEKVQTRLNALM